MNKIIQINLAGQAISIDEIAYDKLKAYLESIEKHFSGTPGGSEILEDIEARIAEMYLQKFKAGKSFIAMQDVEETIEIMGNPAEMDHAEEESQNTGRQQESYDKQGNREQYTNSASSSNKKLFRDTDERILGGVCKGLAAYFDLDVSLVRLLFIVSTVFFGFGLLPYLILWFILPEARTPQEKARMRGSAPDINEIVNNIRKEAEQVADHLKKNDDLNRGIRDIGKFIQKIFIGLGKLAGSLILVAVIAATVSVIFLFLFTFTGEVIHIRSSVITIPQLIESGPGTVIFVVSALLVVLIPIASIMYLLICFIFDISNARYSTKTWFAIWLISLAAMIGSAISNPNRFIYDELDNFSIERDETNTI